MSIGALNENVKIITIDNRYLFTPRIEKEEEMSDSLFSNLYLDAVRNLREICETSKEKDIPSDYGTIAGPECNPVIAFVGGRGSGKTSAMLSFMGAIQDNNSKFLEKAGIKESNFFTLPVIDPTALSKSESLLSVIAAHMYKQIEKIQRNVLFGSQKDLQPIIEALAPELRKLYDSLRLLFQERSAVLEEFGGLERLSALSVGYNLREQFKVTVEKFLDLMACSRDRSDRKGNHSFLVIGIDDLDMNTQMGYQICEEIRKYLTIPRVVVLFSVKMEQLQDAIQLTFAQEYKDAKNVFTLSDSCGGMAEKYLNKLFPINRRHVLPTFELGNMAEYTIRDNFVYPENKCQSGNLVNVFLTLMYRKLGLILIPNQYNSHNLLPKTLRGTIHLYKLLSSMKSVFTGDCVPLTYDGLSDKKEDLKHNINAFWDQYLLNYIENIDEESADMKPVKNRIIPFLYRLRSEPWQSMNRLVARELKRFIEDQRLFEDESSESKLSVDDICSAQTMSANISLGDVLYMLERIERLSDKLSSAEIATYIRTTYSLTMVRLFFAENAPDKLRKFVVQINNPDVQRLVRVNTELDRRDWRIQDMSNITYIRSGQEKTLKEYISELSGNFDDMVKDPLGWILICYAWFGDPNEFNRGLKKWRSYSWDRAYSDSITIIKGDQTKYITINYAQYVANLLDIDLFEDAINNVEIESKNSSRGKYRMVIPLYSAELVNDIVTMQKRRTEERRKRPVDVGFFEMFSEFENGVTEGVLQIKAKGNISAPLGCIMDYQKQAPVHIGEVKIKHGMVTERDRRSLDSIQKEILNSKRRQIKTIKAYFYNTIDKFAEIDPRIFKEMERIRAALRNRKDNDYMEKYEYEDVIQLISDIKTADLENPHG